MMLLTQPSNKAATKFTEALWNKELRCDQVYEEYLLQVISIGTVPETICHSMWSYWNWKKSSTMQNLAGHATLVTKQHRDRTAQTKLVITTSQITAREIEEAKEATLLVKEEVVSRCRCTLHLNTICPDTYADMELTAATPTTFLIFSIFNDDHRRCSLLHTFSCVDPSHDSMSLNSASAPHGDSQNVRAGATITLETYSMDPTERIPEMLTATRRYCNTKPTTIGHSRQHLFTRAKKEHTSEW